MSRRSARVRERRGRGVEGGGFLERTQKARGDKGIVNVISNNHNFTGRLFLAKIYN